MPNQIGVVIPTLGVRALMLAECLSAVRESGANYILLVSPINLSLEISNLANEVILDPGRGLAEAINCGMNHLSAEISYATWVGDDDLFEKNGLRVLAKHLDGEQELSLVYGKCTYIDSLGRPIGVNQIGQLASRILGFGPDLIPQPSSLFRLQDFKKVGGLNPQYRNAFDFDLFLKLKKLGKISFVPEMISYFRWHDDSLSVNQRWHAVKEASKVRRSHLNLAIRMFSFLWEPSIILLTLSAGKLINFYSKLPLANRQQSSWRRAHELES